MTLSPALISSLESRLQEASTSVDRLYPGEPQARQPVHTFYGGAHLFAPDICPKLGKLALRTLGENAPFPGLSDEVMARVRTKLETEPVRITGSTLKMGTGTGRTWKKTAMPKRPRVPPPTP